MPTRYLIGGVCYYVRKLTGTSVLGKPGIPLLCLETQSLTRIFGSMEAEPDLKV